MGIINIMIAFLFLSFSIHIVIPQSTLNNFQRSRLVCDGRNALGLLGPICGRPLGIDFYYKENLLYIADAYKGLLVGANETLAVQLATEAEGVPFKSPDGLNVDQLTGEVYFTDASSVYQISELPVAVLLNDSTGRLLKYNPVSKNVTVLLRGLGGAAGVAISNDSSYVLVSEYIPKRIQKYWLKGPMAFKSEVIINLEGRPDNIRKSPRGDSFWVAVTTTNLVGGTIPKAIEINGNGVILRNISLDRYYSTSISEFSQHGEQFYVGSLQARFVGDGAVAGAKTFLKYSRDGVETLAAPNGYAMGSGEVETLAGLDDCATGSEARSAWACSFDAPPAIELVAWDVPAMLLY
uniref:Strictosidine synthase conserved region domain-containing protein n=1 Tax=Cannabis sativa TaxID=3483 RepID=A0A803P958_CANSA